MLQLWFADNISTLTPKDHKEIFASLKFVPAGELRHAYIAAYRHGKGSKSMGSPRNRRLLVLCKNAITELSVLATAEVRNGCALSLSAAFFFLQRARPNVFSSAAESVGSFSDFCGR